MAPTVLDYYSPTPTFALAFSPLCHDTPSLKLAVGSFNSNRGDLNDLNIVALNPAYLDLTDDVDDPSAGDESTQGRLDVHVRSSKGEKFKTGSAFVSIAKHELAYPPSAIAFSPATLSSSLQSSSMGSQGEATREMIACSSDSLRLWDLVGDDGAASLAAGGGYVGRGGKRAGSRLVERATLANSKADYSAPLTSFSWSELEPTHIVTSSIDTTCTVWDIATGVPITQLIAHDREVYDVAWSPSSRDVFASVGADGSVRMFDLRSLEHSTILYEATGVAPSSSSSSTAARKSGTPTSPITATASIPSPLLRLAYSPTAPNYLSVCHADSTDVQILDVRSPGTPVVEVKGHVACVNGMAWGGKTLVTGGGTSGPGWLATCSDDSTLLIWDLTSSGAVSNSPSSSSASAPSRSTPATSKGISSPTLSYTAPSEVNTVAWGARDWVAAGCGNLIRCLKV